MNLRTVFTAAAAAACLLAPSAAQAFCGFYVAGSGEQLYNNATQVVMMREGTRTVLSLGNNYQGPPADFAMVVPVPVVLKEAEVKTLSKQLFTHVDQLAAPRLVEYWEEDPCEVWEDEMEEMSAGTGTKMAFDEGKMGKADDNGVTVEAEFVVGEYQIVILSAKEATGLENWLVANKYNIPKGADAYLRPYVEGGSKFFVAKVDVKKVKFEDGMAQLSPLRFHYDSPELALPVRLGLMNAKGKQDLIVHILARDQRYEVANYPNVFIPTNLDVKDGVRHQFGEFYATLFDRTLERNPRAVVTEYAWDSDTCDPCPTPALDYHEILALGGDVVGGGGAGGAWVLTRLHARYDATSMSDDLVFRKANPVVGGREFVTDGNQLEEGARPDHVNNFQARYAIRHAWSGEIACKDPVRGRWGGPPGGARNEPVAATDLAFVARDAVVLEAAVAEDIPELGVVAAVGVSMRPKTAPSVPSSRKRSAKGGCGCNTGADPGAALTLMLIAGAVLIARRRR